MAFVLLLFLTSSDMFWNHIWSLDVLQKIIIFLWHLSHGKIMCNFEWSKRGSTNDASCGFYGHVLEDPIHILRDCACAWEIWAVFFPMHEFLIQSHLGLRDWIGHNLKLRIKSIFNS